MEGLAPGKKFKMKGHTLPGINQRSEGDTDLPDGRSASSPFQKHDGTTSSKTHYEDGKPKSKREVDFSERHEDEKDRPDPTYEGTDYYGPKGVARDEAEKPIKVEVANQTLKPGGLDKNVKYK